MEVSGGLGHDSRVPGFERMGVGSGMVEIGRVRLGVQSVG
jgi:hypothetical protein